MRAAEQAVARSLLSGSAEDLDTLALSLTQVLEAAPEAAKPPLLKAMRAAGLQLPGDEEGGGVGGDGVALEAPAMVSPSRHDVAALILELQGIAAAATALEPGLAPPPGGMRRAVSAAEKRLHAAQKGADPTQAQLAEAALRYRRLELQVAELKKTLSTRPPSTPSPVSPRFSHVALSIIRREEQLQRAKATLRSQRAQTAAELERVRRQLTQYAPRDRVHAALERMERTHVQAGQRWEYKREQLLHARAELLEQAMHAFQIIAYERPTSPTGAPYVYRTLLDNSPALVAASSNPPPPVVGATQHAALRREAAAESGGGGGRRRPITAPDKAARASRGGGAVNGALPALRPMRLS